MNLVRLAKEHYPEKDIWVWTGYEFDQIKSSPLTKYIDVAVRSVNLSIGELTEILKKQQFNDFSEIIDNVVYDGLNLQLERIAKKNRGDVIE